MPRSTDAQHQKEVERVARMVISIAETGVRDRKKLYWISFWKGVWGGFGGFLGATLVVAVLLWIFTVVGNVPFVGPVVQLVRDQLK